jgi:hypothetical protein
VVRLIGKVRCVTELVAGNAERFGSRRPGFLRVFLLTGVACFGGLVAAMVLVWALSLTGVATTGWVVDGAPYLPTGVGPVMADALSVLYFSVFTVLVTRPVLAAWIAPDDLPAWTWVAVPFLACAGLAAISPAVAVNGGWAIAAIAVRYTAWDAEGRARREPLLTPRSTRLVLLLVPAVLLAGIAGYALFHPLTVSDGSAPKIARGTSPVLVTAPALYNESSRPVRVLSIEPGRERGYALHLIGVRAYVDGMSVHGGPPTRPVTSFVIKAHDSSPGGMVLQLSRAGCRPGTSGRIESIRVHYRLGGDRVMELPVKPAATLIC